MYTEEYITRLLKRMPNYFNYRWSRYKYKNNFLYEEKIGSDDWFFFKLSELTIRCNSNKSDYYKHFVPNLLKYIGFQFDDDLMKILNEEKKKVLK